MTTSNIEREAKRELITETQIHALRGEFPVVPTYPTVDVDMLQQDNGVADEHPFYITLPISEIGRVSGNGLVHDEALQQDIIKGMEQGVGGIRGHIPLGQESTAFPVDAVHWVGHQRVGETLWAKGYIPPGSTREDTKRKIARGSSIGTSIYGSAVRETVQTKKQGKTWRAKNFELEGIDLAPARRAALRFEQGVSITSEMSYGEGEMPEVTAVTVADVPANVREQIIRESDLAVKVGRVAELEQANGELTAQVAELATYKSIVAEIRTTLGASADIPVLVAEYYAAVSKLTQMLGVQETASISVRVEEMQQQVAEFRQKAFLGAVDNKIADLTNWAPRSDDGKKKVEAFRSNLRRAMLSEMGNGQDTEKVAEVAAKLWDGEFQVLAETVVTALGGPGALVGAKPPVVPEGSKVTDEQMNEWAARYNGTPVKQ
jgi:hypothetical protein